MCHVSRGAIQTPINYASHNKKALLIGAIQVLRNPMMSGVYGSAPISVTRVRDVLFPDKNVT